jgi:hypothetical protein
MKMVINWTVTIVPRYDDDGIGPFPYEDMTTKELWQLQIMPKRESELKAMGSSIDEDNIGIRLFGSNYSN